MARRGARLSTKSARLTSPVRCAAEARPGKSLRKRTPSGSTTPIAAANFEDCSALRLDDDGADLSAAFDLLMGCGGFVQRKAGGDREDPAGRRGPGGDIGLRPAPNHMGNAGERHRIDR